jgi:D-3-phosphoglycerate dehydrogenase / 2-oxoglutarate reductase
MNKILCLNPISKVGLSVLKETYQITENIEEANAIMVRSAVMHEMTLPNQVLAVARAGAGVNNIPLDTYAKSGIVCFNTPGANANAVKELTLAGMLLASRDISWRHELDYQKTSKILKSRSKQLRKSNRRLWWHRNIRKNHRHHWFRCHRHAT